MDRSSRIDSPRGADDARRSWRVWIVCAAAMCALRAWAFDLPLETDESNYAYIGGRLLAGERLYVDVWDHQPPGVFVLFAVAQRLFGSAPIVFRMMALAASLVSLGLVQSIARRIGGVSAGVMACVLFALASADPGTAGEGCNRELFMTPLILAAWALMLSPRLSSARLFIAGAMLGLASVLKTVVAAHWLVGAGWLMIFACADGGVSAADGSSSPPGLARDYPRRWRRLLLFGAGPAMIWIGTSLYFALTGRLSEFMDAVFRFNIEYVAATESLLARFRGFFQPERHPFLFDSAAAVWYGGSIGVLFLMVQAWRGRAAKQTSDSGDDAFAGPLAIVALSAGSYVAVCIPQQFWPHYYYLMIAPLTIAAAAVATSAAAAMAETAGSARWRGTLPGKLILMSLPLWLGWTQMRDYVLQSPLGITARRYNSRDFWAQAHGLKVRSVTDPEDTIFVFGSDAGIYYYSQRRCASRYTMMKALEPTYADAPRRQQLLMDDLRRNPPRVILIVDATPFPEWERFVRENYEFAGADHHDHKPDVIILLALADRRRPIREIVWEWDRGLVATQPR